MLQMYMCGSIKGVGPPRHLIIQINQIHMVNLPKKGPPANTIIPRSPILNPSPAPWKKILDSRVADLGIWCCLQQRMSLK